MAYIQELVFVGWVKPTINYWKDTMSYYRREFNEGGTYFFTVVLQNRKLGLLCQFIELFRASVHKTLQEHPFEIIAIVVLPDHFHLLMKLPDDDDNFPIRIRKIKSYFSQSLPQEYKFPTESQKRKGESGVWQRRYWEHCIRDDKDLSNHIDYIYYNPVKHGYVNNVKDWQWSSFHRDVRLGIFDIEWGSQVDKFVALNEFE